MLALRTLPESLPPERRGKQVRRAVPLDLAALRAAVAVPGVGAAVAVNFAMVLWFAGMEQTFRLFTADGFGMSDAATGRIFGIVGVVGAIVQGGLVRRLAPRFGEARLVHWGLGIQAVAFALLGLSSDFGRLGVLALYTSAGLIALGNGLTTPSLPAFASRRASLTTQGVTLGALQSAAALARAVGPLVGGALYAAIDPRAPYLAGAIGLAAAGLLALARLRRQPAAEGPSAVPSPLTPLPDPLPASRGEGARREVRRGAWGRSRSSCACAARWASSRNRARRPGCGRCASPRRAPCRPRPGTRCAR